MKEKVLITGGSGLVGRELNKLLISNNYDTAILTRDKSKRGDRTFYWDYGNGIIDKEAIEFADIIIHLAGEGIANKRWTSIQKQKIIDSRVKTSKLLLDEIKRSDKKPHTIISASAVGIYGIEDSNKVFNEEDKAADDFVANVVRQWESSVDKFESIGLRTVKLRIGIVISKEGGAYQKMMLTVKYGIGSAMGSGKQFMPWIYIGDLAEMILFRIKNSSIKSTYNAVSPEYITNYEFMKTMAKALKKPFFMPRIPSFVFKLMLGDLSQILLTGLKVSSEKIVKAGFKFKYSKFEDLMKDLS
jgi:uncharacterized protein (TIGR01777 family)